VYKILKDATPDFHDLDNLEDPDKDVAISCSSRFIGRTITSVSEVLIMILPCLPNYLSFLSAFKPGGAYGCPPLLE
jgi:hypothetical protein